MLPSTPCFYNIKSIENHLSCCLLFKKLVHYGLLCPLCCIIMLLASYIVCVCYIVYIIGGKQSSSSDNTNKRTSKGDNRFSCSIISLLVMSALAIPPKYRKFIQYTNSRKNPFSYSIYKRAAKA